MPKYLVCENPTLEPRLSDDSWQVFTIGEITNWQPKKDYFLDIYQVKIPFKGTYLGNNRALVKTKPGIRGGKRYHLPQVIVTGKLSISNCVIAVFLQLTKEQKNAFEKLEALFELDRQGYTQNNFMKSFAIEASKALKAEQDSIANKIVALAGEKAFTSGELAEVFFLQAGAFHWLLCEIVECDRYLFKVKIFNHGLETSFVAMSQFLRYPQNKSLWSQRQSTIWNCLAFEKTVKCLIDSMTGERFWF